MGIAFQISQYWKPVKTWEELLSQLETLVNEYYYLLRNLPKNEIRRQMFQILAQYGAQWWTDSAKVVITTHITTEQEAVITLGVVGSMFAEVVKNPNIDKYKKVADGSRYVAVLYILLKQVRQISGIPLMRVDNLLGNLERVNTFLFVYSLVPKECLAFIKKYF